MCSRHIFIKSKVHFHTKIMSNVREIFIKSDAICFDVDSTVIKEEAIDELAKYLNHFEEVSTLTKKAMGGSMSFRESLKQRLNIIKPNHNNIRCFIKDKISRTEFSTNLEEVILNLHNRKVPIYLITGGFHGVIQPIADRLSIPHNNIFANRMLFYFNGDYAGFDEKEPTSDNGGKGQVIGKLKQRFGYKNLTLIGDGMTDLEASPPADNFIGYGGNIVREAVKNGSKWYIYDFKELL